MTRSPFPGMDPIIEARGLWRDFHDKLIGDMERALAELLPPRYVVRLDERTYTAEPEATASAGSPTAVAMHALIDVEERELYIDIRDEEAGGKLVTGIEVLSPTNKRFGSDGWKEYGRKFLRGAANFVEIDLLREGRRRTMREPWPDSPYYILIARQETAPACTVLPAFSTRPLPDVPVPLLAPDSDVMLPLQSLVDNVIERSRYVGPAHFRMAAAMRLRPEEHALLAATNIGTKK